MFKILLILSLYVMCGTVIGAGIHGLGADDEKWACYKTVDIPMKICKPKKSGVGPDFIPEPSNIHQHCCILWAENDCLTESAKGVCSDAGWKGVKADMDHNQHIFDAGLCKDYKYVPNKYYNCHLLSKN